MKIAFASCCKFQHRGPRQPVWRQIADQKPDLLLLLGDTVYIDTDDINEARRRYRRQFERVPAFKRLLETTPFLATWDDHDFADNNAKGGEMNDVRFKLGSKRLFERYLTSELVEPDHLSPVQDEIYCSYGRNGVRVIVLDERYYRITPTARGSGAQLLGAEQMAWLRAELEAAKGDRLTILCSSSTVKGPRKSGENRHERLDAYSGFWAELSARLRALPNALILSGDIHRNKLFEHNGFWEATSSGAAQRVRRSLDGVRKTVETDNFGLLDIGPRSVTVTLQSNLSQDRFKRVIPLR